MRDLRVTFCGRVVVQRRCAAACGPRQREQDNQKKVSRELLLWTTRLSLMTHIVNHGPSRMVDIADSNGVKSQSLLKVINELESMRYVQRAADSSDSRAKLIALTSAGEQHIEQLSAATEKVWQQYVDDIGIDNTEQIFGGLRQLLSQNN